MCSEDILKNPSIVSTINPMPDCFLTALKIHIGLVGSVLAY